MKKLRIGAKIQAITVVSILGLMGLIALAINGLRNEVTDSRALKTQQLVEVASGVVKHFEAEARTGHLTDAAARQAALDVLRTLRYGEGEYFYVIDEQGRMVMYPIKRELDGKDMSGHKDPTGKALFVEMVETARAKGSGFVSYYWPKPGAEQPVEKISFVAGFKPWGWIIGTGVYADDTFAHLKAVVIGLAMGLACIALVVAAAALAIGRQVTRPVRDLTNAMSILARGDLATDIPGLTRHDEMGEMARAVDVFRQNSLARVELEARQASEQSARQQRADRVDRLVRGFEERIGGAIGIVTSAATELDATARSMTSVADATSRQATASSAAAEQTSANVQTVAAAAEEMVASLQEIERQVQQSNSVANAAARESQATEAAMTSLSEAAERIGEAVHMISSIASQTNLLALNATIEAARAGEAGRGFAVVASEVKELAGQTARATGEIGGHISAIQRATAEAAGVIRQIGQTIGSVNAITESIAATVVEQTVATGEISRNAVEAARGTQDVSANAARVLASAGETDSAARKVMMAAGELSAQSVNVKREVDEFLSAIRVA
ncbi:methyl-accepting chemotaxis protein [Methylobacterium sp. E-045]|uniref:methyl-accepting chemotaxis protein n=1 Tax=Methylobacterium sp. E-045 TaxID=2836575 RepID=UPI001FBB524B|nr:cache domain-containing protein [Methylobacterium sp. E-045]MCJ2129551.1 cache domain-containing protein [Methylobacterium sp. E-045]